MSRAPPPPSSNVYSYPNPSQSDPFADHQPYSAADSYYSPQGHNTQYPPYDHSDMNNPTYDRAAESTYSLPLDDTYDDRSGGYGTERVTRERGNPFAADASKGGSKKWWWIGGVIAAIIAVAVGIAVWRVKASKDNSASSSGTTTSDGSSASSLQVIPGSVGRVKSDPKDPSKFEMDDRLHQSFYGFAYTPKNALEPWCGANQANVTEDIQLLSQLTTRIRLYGSACNQSELVLQAIKDTKVNMTVWLGVYIGDNATVNAQQMEQAITAINEYGVDHISGVTVGNEYLLNTENQATGTAFIVEQMATFRSQIAALKLSKTIPVGTADAGSLITTALSTGADYIMANVHPWFGGLKVEEAAAWTNTYFAENDLAMTKLAPNNPPAYIAETGWPTQSMTPLNATLGGAVAGTSELQVFLDTFPCQASTNGTQYFFFEAFDEPWKEQFGGVEPYWGLMDSNKALKDIKIPTC